ncbi:ATP-binding protein [Streptomyces samsunensis]|nr:MULTISPECIES: ATP-binding protein [Streptomyces]MYU12412.1 ATP-binding protein [Streptomyces sp. SID8361]ATL81130.1 regulatory protein [Streptomyces malaysiensis]MCC4321028.1 ATP-binding protein [Streptomyces malaysiensis]MCM3804805.1 ATP-binding protein [Streptomyces sp. DR7-3]NUH35559.1 ATP-binding protein [Streptomyces samsunensis]
MHTATARRTAASPSALRATLDCRPEAASYARQLTSTFLESLRPEPDRSAAEAVMLIVSELVTNAVRHSGGRYCSLRVSADPEAIAIAVGDASRVPPHRRTPDVRGEGGGFGWPMICGMAMATAVTEEPGGGKTVNAIVARRGRATGRATAPAPC